MRWAAIRIVVVAAVAMLGLIGLVVSESLARAAGTEVILSMETVDPRAILSGHYVTVSLTEPIPAGQTCPPGTADDGSGAISMFGGARTGPTMWIALARRGDRFTAVGAAADRRAAARYAPLLARGGAACTAPEGPRDKDAPATPGTLRLNLGIDRFYVNQAEAERIATLLRTGGPAGAGPVSAIVSIGRDGHARLKGLLVEGRRLELNLI